MRLNRNSTATVLQQWSAPEGQESPRRRRLGSKGRRLSRCQGPGHKAGVLSRHIRERRCWDAMGRMGKGRTGPTAEDQAARTTQGAGLGRPGTCEDIPGRHRVGSTWSGARTGPTPSHQDPLNIDSRASMEEWRWTTPHYDISTTEASTRGSFSGRGLG